MAQKKKGPKMGKKVEKEQKKEAKARKGAGAAQGAPPASAGDGSGKAAIKMDDIALEDAVLGIPANAISLKLIVDSYEGGEIVRTEGTYGPKDIRGAFQRFEDTVSGDYPRWSLADGQEGAGGTSAGGGPNG